MLRTLKILPVLIVVALPQMSSQTSSQAFSVWVLSSLQRAGLQDTPGQARSVALSAARGECTSFQVVLQAPSGGLHNANATASDLAGSAGVIASSNLTFYREFFVRVMPGSPDQQGANRPSGPGWCPDALIPF